MAYEQETREQHFERLTEPQRRGDAAEAIIRAAFSVRDVTVLRPEHDNAPYDFVIEIANGFHRIQAKTAYNGKNPGTAKFETRSNRVFRGLQPRKWGYLSRPNR